MDLKNSLLWMFFGSIFIGLIFNAMNILANSYNDLYFSLTLLYSALFMASNMCLLEIVMYYNHTGIFPVMLFTFFLILSVVIALMLRQQFMVDDKQWLRRMIGHHSTAIQTSEKIKDRTKDPLIRDLATDIIRTQKEEIHLMKGMLSFH